MGILVRDQDYFDTDITIKDSIPGKLFAAYQIRFVISPERGIFKYVQGADEVNEIALSRIRAAAAGRGNTVELTLERGSLTLKTGSDVAVMLLLSSLQAVLNERAGSLQA